MLDQIKHALSTLVSTNAIPQSKTKVINYKYIPLITTKNYHFKPHPISKMRRGLDRIDINNLIMLYISRVVINGKQIFSIQFSNLDTMDEFCLFLLKVLGGNKEFMYLQIKSNIYTHTPDFLRESLDHLQICNFSFLRFGAVIGCDLFPNIEMHFFDGKNQIYSIKIERMHCIYDKQPIEIGEFYDKVTLCRGCNKNNSEVCVIDDPLIPKKDKYLCKICFGYLFLDDNQKLKYKDMDYKYI